MIPVYTFPGTSLSFADGTLPACSALGSPAQAVPGPPVLPLRRSHAERAAAPRQPPDLRKTHTTHTSRGVLAGGPGAWWVGWFVGWSVSGIRATVKGVIDSRQYNINVYLDGHSLTIASEYSILTHFASGPPPAPPPSALLGWIGLGCVGLCCSVEPSRVGRVSCDVGGGGRRLRVGCGAEFGRHACLAVELWWVGGFDCEFGCGDSRPELRLRQCGQPG